MSESAKPVLLVVCANREDDLTATTMDRRAAHAAGRAAERQAPHPKNRVAARAGAGADTESTRLRQQIEEAAIAAERNRIARDLHDSVTQTLFSASVIADVLPRLWERDQDEARRRLEEMRQLTRGALAEMRMMLLELRPNALECVPLADLLSQLAAAAGGRSRIPIAVDVRERCALPPAVHSAFYRIAQEALNNVARHSGAAAAEVSFRCDDGAAELAVSDNGKGFDISAVTGDHLGLKIMRERAQEIGAICRIESGPGEGTRILIGWKQDER